MDESLNERIDRLREESRYFLSQVDENSKRVKEELEKVCSRNSITDESNLPYKRCSKSWKLRNDSRGVRGALRFDCFCNSLQPTSMPNISTTRRVLTSLRTQSEKQCCLEHVNRKPVKECYCNCDTRKAQVRSTRTQHKQHCRNHIYATALPVEDDKESLTPPISCETLRRVQKIDYAPKSQFLRNVQSKVSLLQTNAKGDGPETYSASRRYYDVPSKRHSAHQFGTDNNKLESTDRLEKSESLPKVPVASEIGEPTISEQENVHKLSKGVQVSLKKQSKAKVVIKRTLSSKKSVPDLKRTKSSSKLAKRTPVKGCLCDRSKSEYSVTDLEKINSGDYRYTVCTNKDQDEIDKEHLSEDDVRELKKFREQNYFDTHGSGHTLTSSKSSGSLEQYFLNERLFPEPVKRIHRKDLVVSMPACATVQKKRIHYFPRYIVRQEKNNFNNNCKKKRYQTCPLTGHAIDLGITKIRPPLNSLALKYQKRLP